MYITEIFSSIQGETSLAGLPTTFIRLSGCNLRCTWCDTPYSFTRGQKYSQIELLSQVENFGHSNICITGGEPLLQKEVHPLMEQLCDKSYVVSLETGGSLPIDSVDPRVRIILDIKCPGSEMEHKNLWENLKKLKDHDEVKFVISNREDYEYARTITQENQLNHVLFSPVHGILGPKELVEWILEDQLQVRLNLQIHKYIWGEHTIGV